VDPALARRLAHLEASRRRALAAVDGVPHAALNRPPASGKWSALQVLHHVVTAEALTLGYIGKKMQAGAALETAGPASRLRLLAVQVTLALPLRVRAPTITGDVPAESDLPALRARWDEVRRGLDELVSSFPPSSRTGWCSATPTPAAGVRHDGAAVEHDRARAEALDEGQVVARDHLRGVEAGEQLSELAAAARVESRGRLVEQQQPGLAREGAREAQPPLLPGAQVVREARLAPRETHRRERVPHGAVHLRPRPAARARAVGATSSSTVSPTIWSSGSSNTMPTLARISGIVPGASVTPSIATRPCTSWRWAGAAGSCRCR
jgi:hypothetical protein